MKPSSTALGALAFGTLTLVLVVLLLSGGAPLPPASRARHDHAAEQFGLNFTTAAALGPHACGKMPSSETLASLLSGPTPTSLAAQAPARQLGWQCVAADLQFGAAAMLRVELPREKGDEPVGPAQCEIWCKSFAESSLDGKPAGPDEYPRGCCEWKQANVGGHDATDAGCAWTDGIPVLDAWLCTYTKRGETSCPAPLAFSACSPTAGFTELINEGEPAACSQRHAIGVSVSSLRECSKQCLAEQSCQRFGYNRNAVAWEAARDWDGEENKQNLQSRNSDSKCMLHLRSGECVPDSEAAAAGWQTYERFAKVAQSKFAATDVTARVAKCANGLAFVCPATSVPNVMVMDGDATGTCSQLCLPIELLARASVTLRLERGTCAERGCDTFIGTRLQVIQYNVYACAEISNDETAAADKTSAPVAHRGRGKRAPKLVSCFEFDRSNAKPKAGDRSVTEDECKQWCEDNEPGDGGDEECCDYTVLEGGLVDECVWKQGNFALT